MKIKEKYELQSICGDAMLIPRDVEEIDDRDIITLDPVSEYLWAKVATMESFTTDTLVELLMQEYDVDEATAREDCALIVEAWLEMNIVTE
ncbi:MAG: PqqD family protein [Bacteroidaceae bacterium]|nr:PqqD family protein [Bacteroidaceae bacterium]